MAAREILEIFREGIDRSLRDWSEEEKRKVLSRVEQVLRQIEEGKLSPEDAYYSLVGIAYEHIVPLSPGDLSKLKTLLRKATVASRVGR